MIPQRNFRQGPYRDFATGCGNMPFNDRQMNNSISLMPSFNGGSPCSQPNTCGCGNSCKGCGKNQGQTAAWSGPCNGYGKGYGKAPPVWNEPRYSGRTQGEWATWVQTPHGVQWCQNKRNEADVLVQWMIDNWGLDTLQKGHVIDVGGEPGFFALSLMSRGCSVIVVDPSWRMTGKTNMFSCVEQFEGLAHPQFGVFKEMFDEDFIARYRDVVDNATAIISMYGDEATQPCLEIAARLGLPCAVIPCNECPQFFPPPIRNYEAYCKSCVETPNKMHGARMEWVQLRGAPFSQQLIVQWPKPEAFPMQMGELEACRWSHERSRFARNESTTVAVPVEVLRQMGVLGEALWKTDLATRETWTGGAQW